MSTDQAAGVTEVNTAERSCCVHYEGHLRALANLGGLAVRLQRADLMVGHLNARRSGPGGAHRGTPLLQVDMALMIDIHRLVHSSDGSRRKHRGVVDCCGDDAGADPAPAQCQSKDGCLTRVYPGRGEDDLIRSCSDGGGDHFSSLIHGLGSKPARPVESERIAPARLLRIKPSLARISEHRLARRGVQEDLRNGMRHASKLAREPLLRARPCCKSEPQKRNPYTGDESVVLR